MKKRFFIITMVLLAAYVLSACGSALPTTELPPDDQAAIKVQAVEVAFTGVVEAMSGKDWTVNGQLLAVDPAVVRDGPFQVGDTIKVEGTVNADGSLSISRVEAPSAAELAELPQLGNDNTNSNTSNTNLNGNDNANGNNNSNTNTNTNSNNNSNINNNSNTNTNSNTNSNTNNNSNSNSNTNNNSNSNSNANNNDDDDKNNNDNGNDDSGGGNSGNSNDSNDND